MLTATAWQESGESVMATVRFAWALVGPDGGVAPGGPVVGEVADEGRLARITGSPVTFRPPESIGSR